MLFGNNVGATGKRYENIAHLCRLVHRHNGESVHNRLDSLDRIDLGYNNDCAHTLGSHSKTLTAPAVSCDNKRLARDHKVC